VSGALSARASRFKLAIHAIQQAAIFGGLTALVELSAVLKEV
jgi:hypothetical protein